MSSESISEIETAGVVPITNGDGAADDAHDAADPAPAPEAPASDPTASGDTTGDVAFAVMRGQYDLLLAHEPLVERSDDPEPLHDLRVDIRRLRAALGLFEDA